MSSIPDAALELQALPQWVCWYVLDRDGKPTKPPINPKADHRRPPEECLADTKDAHTWGTYAQAVAAAKHYAGIGFVFSQRDHICGVDLDHCRNAQTGYIQPWATRIISLLNSHTEISPSLTGVHIYIHASLLAVIEKLGRSGEPRHKAGHIEIYDERRYFTWTGNHLPGTPITIEDRQNELTDLYQSTFPEEKHEERNKQLPQNLALSLPDEWIIERASLMRNGNGAKFARLWRGDASDYARPDGSIDHSRADQALLGVLAYWTGRDAARMEALFMRSGLYRPERWKATARSGETYGAGSIRLAIQKCDSVYNPQWAEAHRYQPRKQIRKTSVSANNKKGGN